MGALAFRLGFLVEKVHLDLTFDRPRRVGGELREVGHGEVAIEIRSVPPVLVRARSAPGERLTIVRFVPLDRRENSARRDGCLRTADADALGRRQRRPARKRAKTPLRRVAFY
jgi:hypothetical protein